MSADLEMRAGCELAAEALQAGARLRLRVTGHEYAAGGLARGHTHCDQGA
jgi:hypothetical protein